MDNGKGMNQEKCNHILTSTSNGYGIQNVQQRIHLYCGENYGLTYTSKVDHGTCITMTIAVK